jgi:AcrR family transcriptional regulator
MNQLSEKTAENHRRSHLIDTRRAYVLDAARAVFEAQGMEGASIREIAKKAGYTPGAIYSYFSSKEAIFAALLGESLEKLKRVVAAAKPASSNFQGLSLSQEARFMVGKSMAWFKFYTTNPKELALSFYLFQRSSATDIGTGIGTGIGSDLHTLLNAQLIQVLEPAEKAMQEMGLPQNLALTENTALFAHGVGLLQLQHTGRLTIFKQQADDLFATYLAQLCQRYGPMQDQTSTTIAANNVEEEFLARQKPLW